MNYIKFVRIFLLVLIVIGIGLLLTQKMWVPKVVNMILGPQVAVQPDYANKETPTPIPNTTALNDKGENLFYIGEGGKISVFNTDTKTSLTFISKVNADSLAFSKDGRYLIYNDYGDPATRDVEGILYEYDFQNKETTKLYEGANPMPYDFSSDGKYVLVDTGCCPGDRGITFIDLDKKKVLVETSGQGVIGESILRGGWSPDNKNYAYSSGDVDLYDSLGYDSAATRSIHVFSPHTTESTEDTNKVLLKADYANSYKPVSWIDNNNLVYEQTTFTPTLPSTSEQAKSNADPNYKYDGDPEYAYQDYWRKVYDQGKKSYFSINIKTLVKIPVPKPSIPTYNFYDGYDSILSPSGEWRVEFEKPLPNSSVYVNAYAVKIKDNLRVKLSKDAPDTVAWKPKK